MEIHRPPLEWSTWIRLAYGNHSYDTGAAVRVVTPTPPPTRNGAAWDVAAGIDLTFGVGDSDNLRIGPWIEADSSNGPTIGGEIVVAAMPRKLDMFWYEGEGVLIVRAGANRDVISGAVSYGYRAPWDLFRPRAKVARYQIGLRLVATATRARDDASLWTFNGGIEVEPVGALRYLFGIRAWY